jgi:hypothetical protein
MAWFYGLHSRNLYGVILAPSAETSKVLLFCKCNNEFNTHIRNLLATGSATNFPDRTCVLLLEHYTSQYPENIKALSGSLMH